MIFLDTNFSRLGARETFMAARLAHGTKIVKIPVVLARHFPFTAEKLDFRLNYGLDPESADSR